MESSVNLIVGYRFRKDSALTLRYFTLTIGWMMVFGLPAFAAGPRDAQWKTVDEAMQQGLPKTAIEKLQPILEQSLRDQAYAEAIKAIGRKIVLEGMIDGSDAAAKIARMQDEIAKSPAPMQPMMRAILANWYWHYFQQNRWQFMQRTQTTAAAGDDSDLETWDLPRILGEVDAQFSQALASADGLKNIPIAEYDELLEKGTAPDSYRPTLYDFVAHNAIEFYSAGEQAASRAQDAFELRADSPAFATVDEFLAWQPIASDEESPTLSAIKLFQDLLRYHQSDQDRSAYLDADLLRLQFVGNTAVGEEKSQRYQAALKRFADANIEHPLSSMALALLAESLHQEDRLAEAHKLASQGAVRFAESLGARSCYNLVQQIEAPSSQIATERVWNQPLPTIDVHYRNLTKVHFRLLPLPFEDYITSSRWQPEQLDDAQRMALLAQTPVRAWSADLPATEDFQERVESLAVPAGIKPGSYYLVSSHNAAFSDDDNQISISEVWVSDLALIIRSREDGVIEGFVLDAISGEPRPAARVRAWQRNGRARSASVSPTTTDRNGLFRLAAPDQGSLLIHAASGGHALSSTHYAYARYRNTRQATDEQTVFFTDRSLYRPGQTIHYKGICISVDRERDNYQTIAGRKLTVIFNDANGQEIERVSHRTNDYGSFSGSVTAPRDRVMGEMSITVSDGPDGRAIVSVEEYKRPKFVVSLDAPGEPPKLDSTVKLKGKAVAYTGAAIDGANVRWRVVRRVQYPIWWSWSRWWLPPMPESSQEIAHGTALTEVDGTFEIEFSANPDRSVAEKSEPTFRFTVYADVMDTSGETRSTERSIPIGYNALQGSLTAAPWQTSAAPVEITVSTTTLDGEGRAAEGTLKVYALKPPAKVTRAPLPNDVHFFDGDDVAGADLPAPPLSDPNSWELGEVVFEQSVKTDASGKAVTPVKLPAGAFRAKYETKDRFGKPVTAELPLQVIDPAAKKLAIKVPHLIAAAKTSLEPGEELLAVWGSGYETARAFIEVEHRGRILQSYWTQPGTTQVAIKQKVSETMRGGFTLRVTMVRENRAYIHSQTIDVPWSNKELTLKWEHFVSKLEPAQKETWTLVITGPQAQQAAAEVVAAMYDASLDAFKPHRWSRGFDVFRREQSGLYSQFENELKNLQVLASGWRMDHKDDELSYRSLPEELRSALLNFENMNMRFRMARPVPSAMRGGGDKDAGG
ncbi:MAG: MG2 domain-containing protein [Planctomycetaceae bacterium]